VTTVRFGSKGKTLERLAAVVTAAKVLPQVRFDAAEWTAGRDAVLARLDVWKDRVLVVRSSAKSEDGATASQAGRFTSVLGVTGIPALGDAIDAVVRSYGAGSTGDQVFVQPMLCDVRMSGVAFTRDAATGSPYFVVNYDAASGRTDTITGGTGRDIRTFYAFEDAPIDPAHPLAGVIALGRELQRLLAHDAIDFEFAIAQDGQLYLLQARPLVLPNPSPAGPGVLAGALARIEQKIAEGMAPHPYLFGSRTVYGVMPDWNPAEIIGVRPRPLALSLYKDVITDSVWAYQRNNYGYRNLRSFPLLVTFGGLPYIDVRVSFNSFVPADVDPALAERLVNYYIQRLVDSPGHHDKVEFEIIQSCYTFDLPARLARLREHGFGDDDCARLSDSLRRLTNTIIHSETGLWLTDIGKIAELERRRVRILASALPKAAQIYWLLEDCKRYGTLPFAGLARAGFIAVQMLRSLVETGVLTADDYQRFMNSLDTVGSRLGKDFATLGRDAFLETYGHLRPGTYDILSPRYDEAPERYFDWSRRQALPAPGAPFVLSLAQLNETSRLLRQHGIDQDGIGLFNFIKAAIEGRESSKFAFTRSLSDALRIFRELGEECGLSADDCSYADIACIHRLNASSENVADELRRSVDDGRARHAITRSLVMPPLVIDPRDAYAFEIGDGEPNFVTLASATGRVAFVDEGLDRLRGSVLFIPSADPGYDWVFAHDIAGFVTMYGGANSHMAIRAAELNLPAVIGAGEVLFKRWAAARVLELDCANRQVRAIQ
jgi:hypothetical protein